MGGGEITVNVSASHFQTKWSVHRPPTAECGGGWGCGFEQKARGVAVGGLVGFGFEMCVVSGDTHWQCWTLLPPLPVERNMCKINMFPQPCSEVTIQDWMVERQRLTNRQHRERGSISRGSSCCQGQRQSEAVLGLGSNVGWVIAVIEMWRGPLKYSITQVFKRFKEINL